MLPPAAPVRISGVTAAATAKSAGPALLGKYIRTLNYTAPNASIVHVETNAADGRNAYVSTLTRPSPRCPRRSPAPTGCKPTTAMPLYSAVDLMELAVTDGSVVWIAHDNRLPRPRG